MYVHKLDSSRRSRSHSRSSLSVAQTLIKAKRQTYVSSKKYRTNYYLYLIIEMRQIAPVFHFTLCASSLHNPKT